jgi:hypothetical protein
MPVSLRASRPSEILTSVLYIIEWSLPQQHDIVLCLALVRFARRLEASGIT